MISNTNLVCNRSAFPLELRQRRQWMHWQYSADQRKIPAGKSNDPSTWHNLDELAEERPVAYVFSDNDPYCGVDLDDCLTVDGEFTPLATEVLERFRGVAYAEISPSGTGCKLITKARKPAGSRCSSKQVECYDNRRFWCMTGNVIEGFDSIGDGQQAVEWLIDKYLPTKGNLAGILDQPLLLAGSNSLLQRAQAYVDRSPGCRNGELRNGAFKLAGHLHAIRDEAGNCLSMVDIVALLQAWNLRNESPLRLDELQEAARNAQTNGTPPAPKLPEKTSFQDSTSKTYDRIAISPGISGILSYEHDKMPGMPELAAYRPFPVESLPTPLGNYIKQVAEAAYCDSSFVAMPVLAGLAASIGNALNLRLKRTWKVPPILWCAVVAESGSGKSNPAKQALQPLHTHQKRMLREYDKEFLQFQQKLAIYERDLAAFRKSKDLDPLVPVAPEEPNCPRVVVDDTTIEALQKRLKANPRGVLAAYDELAGWFGGFNKYSKGSGDSSKWLEYYNGGRVIVDRASDKRPLIVDRASVSVCGTIQPGILKRSLTDDFKSNGLAARLLFTMPPRVTKEWTESEVDEDVESVVKDIFDRILAIEMQTDEDGDLMPALVTPDSTSKKLFINYYNRHNQEQQALGEDLRAAYAKLEEVAARLALIIHTVRHALGEIKCLYTLDIDSMSMAVELTEWLKAEARRVYQVLGEDELTSANRKFLEFIRLRGGEVSARDICRAYQAQFPSSGHAEQLLQSFVNAGLGHWLTVETGRRPKTLFQLAENSPPLDDE